jgi:Zn-finger nucleic acid-binding protein
MTSWWALLLELAVDEYADRGRLESRAEPPITLDLRDERCVRCGKPTRYSAPGADGIPTCPSCRGELALPRAKPRSCPADGALLQTHQVSNVAVDRCPSCGGVWLDGGELELVTRAAVEAAKRDPREAEDLLATVLAGLPARRHPRDVARRAAVNT